MGENECFCGRIEGYKIVGASYDGCNGWTTWDTGDIFYDEKSAYEYMQKRYGGITTARYNVEEI